MQTLHARVRGLPARAGQRGVALAVALILLVVITLVGLAAVSGTMMQQRMSANFYDRAIAFQADEAAMRQAGLAIQKAAASAVAPAGFFDCSASSGNLCQSNPFNDPNVPSSNIFPVPTAAFNAGNMVASQPQYIVQYLGRFAVPIPNVKVISSCSGYGPCAPSQMADFYRITARSGDPSAIGDRAYVVLQSVFRE
ncbi:MAG: PilX N-terminal domain-containing pilus assembly protein [Rhodanobacter sp.]